MKSFDTITTDERKSEYRVNLGPKEYCVTVKYMAGGEVWVSLDEWHQVSPTYGHWWCVLASTNVTDVSNDMDAIREAFRHERYQMKHWVQSWQEFRALARGEQGGKKSYYTRHANEAKKQILHYAPRWALAKQLWKEITKL